MIASTQTNHPLHATHDKAAIQSRVEASCKSLRAAGLRITQPRIAILKVLITNGQPLCIEHIHKALNNRSCDLVTVYRCLAAFQEIGLVRRSFLPNGTSLYHLSDQNTNTYHIVTKGNGAIHTLNEETSNRLAAAVSQIEEQLKAEGYTEISHLIEFFAKAPEASANPADRARAGQAQVATV